MTPNTEIARSVRRALFMSACAAGGMSAAFAQEQGQPAAGENEATDEVVVTGSRIVAPNLQSISPVTSLSAEDIVRTGKSTIEDVINEMPQVFSAQGANVSNGANGTATVNMRGLGTNRTLVLINGRRLGPGDPGSTTFASDINMVPAALVQRVELLTGGASSVYGADAVGGVVNFIIDRKFEGVKFSGGYSFYNHKNDDSASQAVVDDAGFELPDGTVNRGYDKTFSFAVGSNFADDRGNATFYVTYRDTDPVLQRSYDYSACTYNSGDDFSCGGSSTTFPARFRVVDPSTGLLYSPDPATLPATNYFLSEAGVFGVGTPTAYNFGPLNYYQRPNKRYTAGTFLNFQANEKAEVYGEFMFLKDESTSQIAASGIFPIQYTVSCDNPLWSTGTPGDQFDTFCGQFGLTTADDTIIEFRRRNIEGGTRNQELNHQSYRAGIGIKGDLSDTWSYDASLFQGTSRISNAYQGDFSISKTGRALDVVRGPGGVATCRSVVNGTDPACIPYNIFSLNQITPAQLAYLTIPLISVGEVTERTLSASMTGDLGQYGWKLGSADDGIRVNFGAEYREVESDFQPDGNYLSGDGAGQGGATLALAGTYRVQEIFFESRIPILSSLSGEVGYRFSDYSGGLDASTDTYKFGLEWSPVDAVRLRGSFQHAVRTPNIYELFATQQVGLNGTIDPCTDDPGLTAAQCANTGLDPSRYGLIESNPAAQYNGFIGGNPDLHPEEADTLSFGIEFHPGFAPGLRVNLDWYSIKIDEPIQNPNQDLTLLNCALTGDASFCSRITRDAQGSLWESPNGFIVDTLENLGQLESSGIDLDASYSFDIGDAGKLRFGLVGTYLDKFETTLAGGFKYDCVGFYGGICTPGTPNGSPVAKWRHKFDTTWQTPWSGLDLSLGWRHFGEVKRDIEFNPSLELFGELSTGSLPTDAVLGARDYLDFAASISVFERYTVRFGANNLLDKDPPLNGSSTCPTGPCNGNTWPQAYDALGRQVFLTIGAEF